MLTKARYLYEHTLTPVDDIAAMLGMSKTPFYKRVQEGGWAPRRVRSATGEFVRVLIDGALTAADFANRAPSPPAADMAAAPPADLPPAGGAPPEPVDRLALAAQLLAVVKRHIAAIERLQDVIQPGNPVEAERNARTLAVMGRALCEVHTLLRPPRDERNDDPDDDSIPLDADEFRRALAEKLEGLVDAERRRSSEGPGGPGATAD
ncbi:MAG TPA: hypothetical protein VN655_15790 [Pseudolabrys sp.]|nr:hypothetical protein [Pseudolabrys sp.]